MRSLYRYIGLLLLVFGLSWSCSPQPAGEKLVSDAGVESTGGDAGVREKVQVADKPTLPVCVSSRECPEGNCSKGKCVKATECLSHRDCKKHEFCFEDKSGTRCVDRCEIDTDCPAGHVCEDGQCHKPNWLKGKLPNEGSKENKPIQVGLGVVPLDFPMGVSMAGFGFRPGPRGGYAKVLGGSRGMYDRFTVKALIVDDGKERVVLLRSPLVFTTDFMMTQIAQKVIKETGIDLTSKMLMVSHHSHSAPARFWNLLSKLGFGSFGGGDFLAEVFDRLAESFARAIILANQNLEPGKIGHAIDRNFDPKGQIFSDRRNQSPDNKNPHLLVLRVDKADGTPIASLVTFPMHGTICADTNLTNDAGGGLELQLEDYLESKYKKRIEVFFMQGSAGDVSPRGDKLGHSGMQQMQMLGYLASQHIGPMFDKIKTKSDITLEIANRRVGITREKIGYKPGEFYRPYQGGKQEHRYGAFQCVKNGIKHTKPEKHVDGKYRCSFSVLDLNGAAVSQFSKTRLTALRLGDLFLSSFPGEVTSVLSSLFVKEINRASGGKIKDHIIVGYAQDHHLYILTEDDWLKGGYEASMNVWGPKFGGYLMNEAKNLVLQLITPEKEKNDTGILPQDFYGMDLKKIEIPREKSPDAGTMVTQPPKQYKRMDKPIQFVFKGGFNGTDLPRSILQKKQQDGSYKDVMLNGVRPYDDSGHRMIFTFEKVKSSFHYTFSFEELHNFPVGMYRFRVEGTQWDGSKRVPYTLETEGFEVVPTDKLKVWGVQFDGQNIAGYVSYPSATNDDGKTAFRLKPAGYRLRSPLVTWRVGAPLAEKEAVDLTIVFSQGGKKVAEVTATQMNQRKSVPQTVVTSRDDKGVEKKEQYNALASGFELKTQAKLPAGQYDVTIAIKDAHGNTGAWKQTLTVK